MDWLKELFGEDEELFNKVKEAVEANTVSKAELEQANTRYAELEQQSTSNYNMLTKANETIKTMTDSAGEHEDLRTKYEELQQQHSASLEQSKKEILNGRKSAALEKGLGRAKADEKMISLLMKDFDLEGLELDENGAIKDWDALLQSKQEAYPSAFPTVEVETEKPGDKTLDPDVVDDDKARAVMGLPSKG